MRLFNKLFGKRSQPTKPAEPGASVVANNRLKGLPERIKPEGSGEAPNQDAVELTASDHLPANGREDNMDEAANSVADDAAVPVISHEQRMPAQRAGAATSPPAPAAKHRAALGLVVGERAVVEFLAASLEFEKDVSREAMTRNLRVLKGPEAQLSDDLFEKASALLSKRQPKKRAARKAPPRPIVLARKPRERGRDWSQDHSWFGGLPKLGGAPWPQGPDGVPLPFAAQIDLTEVAAACPESALPREGSLAFFLNKGAVIYVTPGEHTPTPRLRVCRWPTRKAAIRCPSGHRASPGSYFRFGRSSRSGCHCPRTCATSLTRNSMTRSMKPSTR